MHIDQLPSGSWRIRETYKGKAYTITVKRKPTDKIARDLMDAKIHKNDGYGDMSFKKAAETYIESKNNVLSPSTIWGYNSMLRNIPEDFLKLDCTEINPLVVQQLINKYAADHSPKSVHNLHGFVVSVLRLFNPEMHIHTTLPQIPRKTPHTPSQEDIKRLLEEAKPTEFYAAIYLAAMSLRVSEICGADISDLDGDRLTIHRVRVYGENGYVYKETPKTDASNRTIILPQELVEWIQERGYIYRLYPNQIGRYLNRTLPKLGIPVFSAHKLRHFFASYAHELGYSDAVIQSMGGWTTDHVMKRVYRHAMGEEEAVKSISQDFTF